MSDFRLKPTAIDPVYMTQAEANAVMELWAELQREEASRLAMVTVHDVAETIQVSPEQVKRLLQAVRQGDIRDVPNAAREPIVLPGSDRTWAWSGVATFGLAVVLAAVATQAYLTPLIVLICVLWSIFMAVLALGKSIDRWISKQATQVATSQLGSLSDERFRC
jgi:Flp pilus assembly protein TadB